MSAAFFSDKDQVQIYKGVAILAVVLLHLLATLPAYIYIDPEYRVVFIFIDQLLRYCVPVFVGLSGYSLARKYTDTKVEWRPFVLNRLEKLIPLYLLWSLCSIAVLSVVGEWGYSQLNQGWLRILFLGRADYQLYFVPMIFQLYLLFPLLQNMRHKNLLLGISLLIQLSLYWLYASLPKLGVLLPFNFTDQLQYVFSLSWIGYFMLGIWLGHRQHRFAANNHWRLGIRILCIASLLLAYRQALTSVEAGVDPIDALKFTRPLVMMYSTALLCLLLTRNRGEQLLWKISQPFFSWAGKYSYMIFLVHTIPLRIFDSWWYQDEPLAELSGVTLAYMAALGATIIVSKKLGST